MRSAVVALLVLTLLVPALPRADDWDDDGPPGGWPSEQPGYDVSVDLGVPGGLTVETFDAPLSPYGEWLSIGAYGRVWRPRVAPGWRPYYYGRWEWTNEGWLWVSDEPYGWAVYHYGRWAHDPYYGWIWVPGNEWAPAWVSWRYSGDVVGWAPLSPGVSIYVASYPFVDFCWTFVPTERFVSVPVYQAAYAPAYTRQWYYRSAPAPARPAPAPGMRPLPAPSPAWGGPAPRLVSERIGRPLTPARIVQAPAPGARARPGEIPIYRPAPPARGHVAGAAPAPAPAWGAPRPGDRAPAPPGRRLEPQRREMAAPPPSGRPEPPRSMPPPSGWHPEQRPAAPPPGWRPEQRPAAPPAPPHERPSAPAPGWRPEPRPAPTPAPQPRGESHGGGRAENDHERRR